MHLGTLDVHVNLSRESEWFAGRWVEFSSPGFRVHWGTSPSASAWDSESRTLYAQFPISLVPVAVILLQSILVGVLGDFHFQALRIYPREEKLLHGYYVYEGTVQPAGGTFPAGLSGRRAQGTLLQQAWS